MTTQTQTLADFLLVRIAEDEAFAQLSGGEPWTSRDGDRAVRVHIARHNPARVLAECRAKRRIVEIAQAQVNGITEGRPHRSLLSGRVHDGTRILAALALPYADHPDFREEWRA